MTYKWLGPSLIAGILMAAVSGGVQAQSYPIVKLGQQFWPSLNIVAQTEGLFEEEFGKLGASVEYTYTESGAGMNVALAAGGIDIALVGAPPAITAIAQNIPIRIVWVADKVDSAEGLVVRKGISEIAQLTGKKVAAPFVSTAHFGLLAALDAYGVDKSGVEIIDLRPPDGVAAFARGDIDGMYVWDPFRTKLINEFGAVSLLTTGDLERRTNGKRAMWDLVYARAEFVEKYPELVEAYVRAMNRATKIAQSDPGRAAAAMKDLIGATSVKDVEASMGGLLYINAKEHIEEDALRGLAKVLLPIGEFFLAEGQLERAPSLDEILAVMYDDAINAVAEE